MNSKYVGRHGLYNDKPISEKNNRKRKLKDNLYGYMFLLPFVLFYGVFNFFPLVKGFVVSFFDWSILGDKTFIGFDNYIKLFGETNFWNSLTNTLMYVLISTPIFIAGAFLMAVLIDSKLIKGKTFLRASVFLPNVLAVSITAVIWLNMLQPYTGFVNSVLHAIGIEKEIFWFADKNLVWWSIIWVTFWWNVGYYMILFLAGLQDIPKDLYEAATIDGASGFQSLIHITIPSLVRTTLLVVFLQIIASFKIFGQVFLITEGGPSGASRTLIQYIYEVGFQRFLIGKASAASMVLFIIVIIVSVIQLRIMDKYNEREGKS